MDLEFVILHYFSKILSHYLFKCFFCSILSLLFIILGLQLNVLDYLILSQSSCWPCYSFFFQSFILFCVSPFTISVDLSASSFTFPQLRLVY